MKLKWTRGLSFSLLVHLLLEGLVVCNSFLLLLFFFSLTFFGLDEAASLAGRQPSYDTLAERYLPAPRISPCKHSLFLSFGLAFTIAERKMKRKYFPAKSLPLEKRNEGIKHKSRLHFLNGGLRNEYVILIFFPNIEMKRV